MLGLLPDPANRNQGLVGDDDHISSNYGGGSGFHGPVTDVEDGDSSSVSDCESVVSGNSNDEGTKTEPEIGVGGLIRVAVGDKMYEIIQKRFISGFGAVGVNAEVECIHRNPFNASAITLARLHAFQIFIKAVESKNGASANLKYAWFGASKDEINKIILHGFGHENINKSGAFGSGIYLSADHSPLESVKSAMPDSEGTRHILLCRVVLGKMEVVNPGSTQCHPSSEEFQTGVDNLVSPKTYIVWSTQMNTCLLPEFVVSFKTLAGFNRPPIEGFTFERPASPWIPIPALIVALSKILPPEAIRGIAQYRRSYIERKISRRDMIQGIREFAGDRLLLMVLKDFRDQKERNQVRRMEQVNGGEQKCGAKKSEQD